MVCIIQIILKNFGHLPYRPFGIKCAPCFCHFLHPKWCCTRLSFSELVYSTVHTLNISQLQLSHVLVSSLYNIVIRVPDPFFGAFKYRDQSSHSHVQCNWQNLCPKTGMQTLKETTKLKAQGLLGVSQETRAPITCSYKKLRHPIQHNLYVLIVGLYHSMQAIILILMTWDNWISLG